MSKRNDGTSSGRRVFACRVDVSTPEIVEALATDLGCPRISRDGQLTGAAGILLDRIAQGKLKVIPVDLD